MAVPAFETYHWAFYENSNFQSTLPTDTVEGDYLVVSVAVFEASYPPGDIVNEPSGWTVIANDISSEQAVNFYRIKLLGKFVAASEPTNTVFGFFSGFSHVLTVRYSGVNPVTPVGEASIDHTDTDGLHTFQSIDVLDNTLAVAAAHGQFGNARATPAGWTGPVLTGGGEDSGAMFVHWTQEFATGQTIATFTSQSDAFSGCSRQSTLFALNGVSDGAAIPVFRNHYRMLQRR